MWSKIDGLQAAPCISSFSLGPVYTMPFLLQDIDHYRRGMPCEKAALHAAADLPVHPSDLAFCKMAQLFCSSSALHALGEKAADIPQIMCQDWAGMAHLA